MKEFLVRWEMKVVARDEVAAAACAKAIQQRPVSSMPSNTFDVLNNETPDRRIVRINLGSPEGHQITKIGWEDAATRKLHMNPDYWATPNKEAT